MLRSLHIISLIVLFCFSQLNATTSAQVLNGISVTLQPDGTASIPASCLVKNQCAYEEIYIIESYSSNGMPPPPNSISLEIDCDALGVLLVEIWAKNFLQEWSVAETYLIVEDALDICDNTIPESSDYVIAKNGLSYSFDADGMASVHVNDFIAAYSYPEGQSEPIFSFSSDLFDTLRVFDCNSDEINLLEIYSHNGVGPSIFTPTYCILDLNSAPCSNSDPNCCSSSFSVNNGLAIPLPPEQTVVLKVEDLVNTHPNNVIQFAFSEDPTDNIRLFDCEDLDYSDVVILSIYGFDQNGNYSKVETYILLQDYFGACEETFTGSMNGNACQAYDITGQIDACLIYGHNINAFTQSFEPFPPFGDCDGFNSWCTAPQNTAWFYFDAPASGSVNIYSSCLSTQLALWEATSCGPLTFGEGILVAADANADGSPTSLESISCLIPGNRYYLAVDGQNGMTGPFEIVVEDANIDCLIASDPEFCGSATTDAPVNATLYWQHFYADDGESLIASIANYFTPLGEITAEYLIHEGPVRLDSEGLPYLDRNWIINVSTQPTEEVRLRLYFTEAELQALQAADGTINSAEDLMLNRVEGGSCGPFDGISQLYTPINSGLIGSSGIYYIEFEIPGFSSFYLSSAGLINSTLSEPVSINDIILSPNPTRDYVNINLVHGISTTIDASFYNSAGKLVKQLFSNNDKIDISDLLPGVYYLKIQTGGYSYAERLLIN